MSFAQSNPFALLGDDAESPADVAPAVAAPAQKAAAVPPAQPSKSAQIGKQQQSKSSNAKQPAAANNNNNKYNNNKNTSSRPPAAANGQLQGERSADLNPGAHEQSAKRRHGNRPRRGQRGGWHGHGRQFDRHSALPKDSDKKVHQGWGDAESQIVATENGEEQVIKNEVQDDQQQPEVDGEVVEVSPEPEVKTLDEYLAEKAQQKLSVKPKKVAVRRANEGADESKWSNAVPLDRKAGETNSTESYVLKSASSSSSDQQKKKNVPKQKQTLDIEVRFSQPAVSRESRGSRGGYRGGSGRGGREQRGSKSRAPNLNDTSAFPILAK